MFKKILHPTDLTEATVPALRAAHDLAKELGSQLVVCFIANPPMVASGDTLTNPQTDESRNIAEEVEALQPSDPKVAREIQVLTADPSTSVKSMLELLHDRECDLLVVGVHKKTGVKSWFGASITEEVVRYADCTVMVVKHHGETEEEVEPSA